MAESSIQRRIHTEETSENCQNIILLDIEANGLLDTVDKVWTIQVGNEDGSDTQVYTDEPGYDLPPIAEGLERIRKADKVVIHNGMGYDFWVMKKFYPGVLDKDKVIDTLILSRMRNPESREHSLEALGAKLGVRKGEHDDYSRISSEMIEYGRQDIAVLAAVWQDLKGYWGKYRRAVWCEHRVGYILAKQEQHGFAFNVKKAQMLESELRARLLEITDELRKVFPPKVTKRYSDKTGKRLKDKVEVFNPGSRQQVASRLIEKYGWKPKAFTNTGQPQVDESVLGSLPYPEAKLLCEYLRIGKMLGQLADGENAWLRLERGGRIYGRVNQCGTRTHRMSHSRPNLAQVDKDKRMRALFEPDEGQVLVGCDAEGLELRKLAHYLGRYDGGAYAKTVVEGVKENETDVHNVNKRAIGLHLRDSAKSFIYALIYGGQDPMLGSIIIEDAKKAGKPKPSGSKRAIGNAARKRILSSITGLDKLVSKVQSGHDPKHGRILYGLDGRPIRSSSEHSALNTLLQSAGAIAMKWALVIFDDILENEYPDHHEWFGGYCANVHDEVQMSVAPERADEIGRLFAACIERAGEELGVRCPLAGDYVIGNNWAETH